MKSKFIFVLLLLCITASSASALTVSLSCRAKGNVIYCNASNTNATHYKWEWRHIDDPDYMITDWISISSGDNNVFTCTKAGRHIIRLSAKNGSEIVTTQRGVDMHHGEKTRETLAVTTTEEKGKADPTPLGTKTLDWIGERTFEEALFIFVIIAVIVTCLLMIKKKEVKKKR